MTAKPLVTVAIPTYNSPQFLKQAIESVLQQGLDSIEIIVVDDCSTDNTVQVVKDFTDPRVHYHRTPENLRPPRSWNVGARLARGEFFALLPHDDVHFQGFLAVMVAALREHPEAGFAQCAFYHLDHELRPVTIKRASERPVSLSGEDALIWQMEKLLCNPAALLFRTSTMLARGLWREDYWDDWAFIVRTAYHHGFVFTPRVLAGVREHGNNLSYVLLREGRDGSLDIANQQADVFGQVLPLTERLRAFQNSQRRSLSYSCILLGIRAASSGRFDRTMELWRRALSLHSWVPLDLRIISHIWRGAMRRVGRPDAVTKPVPSEALLQADHAE